jgi:hypothetical protein
MVQSLYCGRPLQRLNMEELRKQMTIKMYGKGIMEKSVFRCTEFSYIKNSSSSTSRPFTHFHAMMFRYLGNLPYLI